MGLIKASELAAVELYGIMLCRTEQFGGVVFGGQNGGDKLLPLLLVRHNDGDRVAFQCMKLRFGCIKCLKKHDRESCGAERWVSRYALTPDLLSLRRSRSVCPSCPVGASIWFF